MSFAKSVDGVGGGDEIAESSDRNDISRIRGFYVDYVGAVTLR